MRCSVHSLWLDMVECSDCSRRAHNYTLCDRSVVDMHQLYDGNVYRTNLFGVSGIPFCQIEGKLV